MPERSLLHLPSEASYHLPLNPSTSPSRIFANYCQQVMEPINLLGKDKFAAVDIRIRVKGGGQVAQIYGVSLVPGSRTGSCHSLYTTTFSPALAPSPHVTRAFLYSHPPGHRQVFGGLLPEV